MRLKMLLVLAWVLLLPTGSLAQNVSGYATLNQIDGLITAEQVQQFVRARTADYTTYKEFVLSDSLETECYGALICVAPGGHTSWLKADFDNNGRTDLLVTGYPSSNSLRRRIVCFLDQGDQNFKEVRLNSMVYDCAVTQSRQVKSGAAIRYAHIVVDGDRWANNPKTRCQVDTLVFDRTQFVEYNHAPKDYHIQKVAFSTTQCLGTCPVFDLQISQSGAATYNAGEYSKKLGKFRATIDAVSLRELWTLLNYLDFPKLNDHYDIGATDYPTCTLTITYAGGQTKTIEDYGEQGTFGLSQAYELLFTLRTTQAWK